MSKRLASKQLISSSLSTLEQRCREIKTRGITPTLNVILVGNNKASILYTNNKKIFMEKFGAKCEIIKLPETISKNDFIKSVDEISKDKTCHGCFVQLPLPIQLQDLDVGQLIPPEKDVDGFHMKNLYHLLHGDTGEKSLLPCTPKGCVTLLNHFKIPIEGKNIIIIGRSMIVGKPLALLLTNHNATVSVCHSKTQNLEDHTHRADIIISAVGSPRFFTKNFLNPTRNDQILIDVGINFDADNKLCGDMDFDNLYDHCNGITPVPGGIGPMTILSLADNLLAATQRQMRHL